MKLEISLQGFEKYSDLTKLRPMGTTLSHAECQKDRRTYITRLTATFRKFTIAPKNSVENLNSFKLLAFQNLLFYHTHYFAFSRCAVWRWLK